jgi:transglutaminase-like putative cysteine protease
VGISRAAAWLWLLASLAGAPAAAQTAYLYQLSVRGEPAPAGAETWRLALHAKGPERLARSLNAPGAVVEGDALVVALPRAPTLAGGPEERHRKASFVLDWDEPPVAELHARLASAEPTPSLGALRDFVREHIRDKTLERSWDLASVVARSGAGDCTEHAVLLAALARSFGRPARVVQGVLLVPEGGRVAGYGHAWTEIHADGAWHVVDATFAVPFARYVPLFAVEQEGPGYGAAMSVAMQSIGLREIELLPPR